MRQVSLRQVLIVLALAGATRIWAADEPLRVYAYGGGGALVYVTPQRAMSSGDSSSSEIGLGAFGDKYYRGRTPLAVKLKPGQYLVSVLPAADYVLRDASRAAGEHVWDGYDYHALVQRENGRFRYAQCYLIEKVQGFAVEVQAVFTDQMPDARPISYDLGGKSTRFADTEEAAGEQLTAGGIPMIFHEDIIRGLMAGSKVLLRHGGERFAVSVESPVSVRIRRAYGAGAWAGHRLNICAELTF